MYASICLAGRVTAVASCACTGATAHTPRQAIANATIGVLTFPIARFPIAGPVARNAVSLRFLPD
jgi:hypothetical protein